MSDAQVRRIAADVTFLLKHLPRLVMICDYTSYVDLLKLPKTLKAMMTEQRYCISPS